MKRSFLLLKRDRLHSIFLVTALIVSSLFFVFSCYEYFFKNPKVSTKERIVHHNQEPTQESRFVEEYPVDSYELIKVILVEVHSSKVEPQEIAEMIRKKAKESGADIVFEANKSQKNVYYSFSFFGNQKTEGATVSQHRFFFFKKK
jgi:hypothetical protein